MSSYLLLRSNKESGPYSLEELVSHGLKPYDLVWVKGKSAAWRYPSEIDELQPYSSPVEEQPFDRFYKKPEDKKPVREEVKIAPAAEKKPVQQPEPEVIRETVPVVTIGKKPEQSALTAIPDELSPYLPKEKTEPAPAYVPKKSVFVTMPGQTTVKATVPEKKVIEKEVVKPVPAPVSVNDYQASQHSIDEPIPSKVKYSQPLDDIKEMYVKTLQERKTKIARSQVVKTYLKRAAVIVGLIGVGVLAGFIMKPKSSGNIAQTQPQPLVSNEVTPLNQGPIIDPALTNSAESKTMDPHKSNTNPREAITAETETASHDDAPLTNKQKPSEVNQTSVAEAKQAPAERKEFQQKQLFAGAEKNPVTGERTKAVRDNVQDAEQPVTKSTGLSGLESQVSVKSNDYKRVAFGGIRDLRLTVTNRSRFELDNVLVELQYLKPSEEPLKTETVEFRFIGPNESSTIRIPDTNRGIKVAYKIIRIGSKQNSDVAAGL